MHHKRRRPKNRRAGCLLCKGWKMNGAGSDWRWAITRHEKAAMIDEREQRETVGVRYPDMTTWSDPLPRSTGPDPIECNGERIELPPPLILRG